jgi:hypothetical protein
MFDGTINITGIILYREEAIREGKSDDYIQALSDLIDKLKKNKDEFDAKQKEKLEKLNKRRNDSISSELVTVYHYERVLDNTIQKRSYLAVEKKNSYEVKNCRRARLSKKYDINKFTDILKHEMWTDNENDELMEELLEHWQ